METPSLRSLEFVSKHRNIYLRFIPLGGVLILTFAAMQINLMVSHPTPHHFALPLLVGLIIGSLLATLIALRREVLDSQRMFRAVADMAQEFVYIRRIDGSYEYVSPSCLDLTGYPPEDFYAQPNFMTKLVLPEDRPLWDTHVHQMDHHGHSEKLVVRIFTRDGHVHWIQHLCSNVRDAKGKIFGVRSTNLDITERIEREKELALSAVAFQTHEAILITAPDATIVRVNQAFEEITGFSAEDVIGQSPRILQSDRHDADFYRAMWSSLRGTGKWSGEVWDRRKNGEVYPKFMTITAVYDDKQLANYVAVFTDISQRKQSEEEIHQLAFYDLLTQLPNRRLFLDRLRQSIAASMRSGRHGALLILDLDHFKTINDTLGHAMGDLLLIEVAHRLKDAVREGDTVARLGGDEFVVVFEGLSSQPEEAATQAELAAEKIRIELGQPYALKNYEYHSTPSIGVSLFLGHLESEDELLKHADVALYQAKTAGRNAIRFYDPKMQAAVERRAAMEMDLRHALGKQQFQLHYQVQVDSLSCPLGAEALLRWEHPERGMEFPDQFIPLAEETGLIVPIGLWVLEAACAQLKVWQDNPLTRDLTLAVNVSARQFHQADFVAQVKRVLLESGAKPGLLKLELTESVVLDNVEDTISKMQALKLLGVEFSMDDFGTGHSSLSYLKRLPLSQIKIDRSFVRDIATDPNDAAIVSAIIAMTEALELNVIAEGVETEEQRDFLDRHGCHVFQGYLFSRPVTLKVFEEGLQRSTSARG
jgi:diguanylate cyclase (GGDEF)-like protein/PAS domain S-box-containing protein